MAKTIVKELRTKDIRVWYEKHLQPILVDVEHELKQCEDKLPCCAWQEFGRNSFALFELLNKANCTNQYMMTLRLLYEMVADLFFFYKNNKMQECDGWLVRVAKCQKDSTKTPEDIMKIISGFRVDGGLKPEERVAEVFNNKSTYAYLSCFGHFNIMGVLWNRCGYPTAQEKEQWEYRRRFILLLQYPVILEKAIEICSEVIDCDHAKHIKSIDYQKLSSELMALAPHGFTLST